MSARIEEIRTENHFGDVSTRDIEWLCKVAEAAERVLFSGSHGITEQDARSDLRRAFEVQT